MQHISIFSTGLRGLGVLLASCALPALLCAQVSLYGFTQSSGTYTEITEEDGGVFLGVPTFWPQVFNSRAWVNNPFNDPDGQVTSGGNFNAASGPGYPIGFDFTFNGDVFDRIGISNGGWIGFGKSSDNLQAVWVYNDAGSIPFAPTYNNPTPSYKRNRVAGFGNGGLQLVNWSSLAPPGWVSRLQMTTLGTAPNRVCVIQWKDFGMRNDYAVTMNRINFQIRLNEVDNSVEVVFGPQHWDSHYGRQQPTQSGLGGRTSDDFNGRMTEYGQPSFVYDWNTTLAATSNQDVCSFAAPSLGMPAGSGVPPATGLTWRWQPPVCPPPAWPFTISDITFSSAVATWQPSAAGEYEYFVSTENSVTGPEVASGISNDPEAAFEELEPGTRYYVFLRSICDGIPGVWSTAVQFVTLKGGVIACDGGVENELYCSNQNSTEQWLYYSADGSPLRLEFLGGYVGTANGESFGVWLDGAPTTGPASRAFSGNLAGQFVQSSTGQIYIRYITTAGACAAQDWYLPIEWRIGCKNCSDPLVNYSLGTVNCEEQEYYLNVDIFGMGSSTSLVVTNSLGLPSTTLVATGLHEIGPFPAGTPVMLLAQNPDYAMCYSQGQELVNEPCAIQDCGPTWYENCPSPSAVREWLLQGEGEPIALRFPPVYMGWDADVYVYDGADDMAPVTRIVGTTANNVVISTNPQHMLLVRHEASIYTDFACSQGNTDPLRFVVECADGCRVPVATFGYADCSVPESYNIVVNVADLGGLTGLMITNDGGLSGTAVNAPGSYTVGPFPSGTSVNLLLAAASEVCRLNSPVMLKDCLSMSVEDVERTGLRLFPNPNDGSFRFEVPMEQPGVVILKVLDAVGRVLVERSLLTSGTVHISEDLPSGLYTLQLLAGNMVYSGRMVVQR